jgi:hypothetical protein
VADVFDDGPIGRACSQIALLAMDLAVAARRAPTPRAIRAAVSAERVAVALHHFNSVLADLLSRDQDDDNDTHDEQRRAA